MSPVIIMNSFSISITAPGTKKYPLHQHTDWEIMYYLSGVGNLATQNESIPFRPGCILIVPPGVVHGSVSQNGFVNISIGGDFNRLFFFDKIVAQQDNASKDGERLAKLIWENHHSDTEYLAALCNAYIHFLLQNAKYENRLHQAIQEIIAQANRHFFDSEFDITSCLKQSGYAEDYIRAQFKQATALSPIDFLTKLRIDHACKLFEIYGDSITVAAAAEICGFEDSVYFSKRFKQITGFSPTQYKSQTSYRG